MSVKTVERNAAPANEGGLDLQPQPKKFIAEKPPRVLFGTLDWPTGLIDLGSSAKKTMGADVSVFYMQPTYVQTIALVENDDPIRWGQGAEAGGKLREYFAKAGEPLASGASIKWVSGANIEDGYFEIRSEDKDIVVKYGLGRLVVSEHANFKELRKLLRSHTHQKHLNASRFFDGEELNQQTRNAILRLGGAFVKKLLEFNPHVVGYRLETGGIGHLTGLTKATRHFSEAKIVVGGPTPTSHPKEVLAESGADYVFAGEAEEPFNRFLEFLGSGDRFKLVSIPGLAYRHGDRVYHNTLPSDGYGRTKAETDIRGIGETTEGLLQKKRPFLDDYNYELDWGLLENFTQEMEALNVTGGRGCYRDCIFCSKQHGYIPRIKSAQLLMKEIKALDRKVEDGTLKVAHYALFSDVDGDKIDWKLREREVMGLNIFDEDFFLDKNRAKQFFEMWEKSGFNRRYRLNFQTNPTSFLKRDGEFDEELMGWIERLKPMIQLGGESFNPAVLKRWNKPHTPEQLEKVSKRLSSMGLDHIVFTILSDQETTAEELIKSLELFSIKCLENRHMQMSPNPVTCPEYDSHLRLILEHKGLLKPKHIRHFDEYLGIHYESFKDPFAAELIQLVKKAGYENPLEAVLDRLAHEYELASMGKNKIEVDRLTKLHEQTTEAIKNVRMVRKHIHEME